MMNDKLVFEVFFSDGRKLIYKKYRSYEYRRY